MGWAPRRAWADFSGIRDPGDRGRALFALVPCFPAGERRPLYEQVAAAASEIPDERARAEYLLDTLGQPAYDPAMEDVGSRLVALARTLGDPLAQGLLLARFARPGPRLAKRLVAIAASLPEDAARVRLLTALPHYALLDLDAYLDVVESLAEPDTAAEAVLPVARYASSAGVRRVARVADAAGDLLRNDVRVELEAFVDGFDAVASRTERRRRNERVPDPELRALCQVSVLSLGAPEEENRTTARLVLRAVEQVAGPDLRAMLVERYVGSLPGGAPWWGGEALRLVLGIAPPRLRARGLAAVAHIADPRRVLEAAEALGDPWATATVVFAYRYGDPPDGRGAGTWLRRLHANAKAVAEPVPRARFLTLLASRWEARRAELAGEALHAAMEIADPWARAQAADRVFELAPPEPEDLHRELELARQLPDPRRRARAAARLARHLPRPEAERIIDGVLAEIWETVPHPDVAATVRLVVADGQVESWRAEGDPW